MFEFGNSVHREERFFWLCVAALFALTAYRLIAGFIDPLPFQVDEAQYVGWSHFLAAGYYSKPPFIAWAIAASQSACSHLGIVNIEGCARSFQPLAFFIAALGVIGSAYEVARDKRTAAWAGILFITSPLVGFYSIFVTTDAWLLMFWSLALWTFLLALQSQRLKGIMWVTCGMLIGLGLLSKYSMAAFLLSGFFHLLWTGRLREVGPWSLLLAALLVFSPNLLWNINNDFPTFAHHLEIAQIARDNPSDLALVSRISSTGSFLLVQFGLFGPLLFFTLLFSIAGLVSKKMRIKPLDEQTDRGVSAICLLQLMTWVILAIAMLQAFSSRSFANWAAPAYVSGSILVSMLLSSNYVAINRNWRTFTLVFSAALGLVLSVLIVHGPKIIFWASAPKSYEVRALEKIRGWKEVALWTKNNISPHAVVAAEDRRLLAAIAAYSFPVIQTPYAWNPEGRKDSHYTWFLDLQQLLPKTEQPLFLLQLVKPVSTPVIPKIPGYRLLREVGMHGLPLTKIGADQEHLVIFEFIRRR